jgi:hypothetical protein
MKKVLRKLSVILTVVIVMSAFAVPAAAGQENNRGRGEERSRGRQNAQQIQYLDAEVQMINGQPVIAIETRDGNVTRVPFQLPQTILVDGKLQPIVTQGGAVVFSTEDGSGAVHLEDFDVVMADGQLILLTEANPLILIPIAFYGLAGAAAGGGLAALFGASKKAIAWSAIGGAVVGGAYGATR